MVYFSHKQPAIDKMLSEGVIDKAIQMDDQGLDFENIKQLIEPFKKRGGQVSLKTLNLKF